MKRTFIHAVIICFGLLVAAQVRGQKVFFSGLGRALVTSDQLKGNTLSGDSVSPRRGTEGYVLFDLGINMVPYDFLKAKAIIRLKNKFGAFYGSGATVEFRQILLEGLIAKKIRYAIGDIDVKMTPYTVFNNETFASRYEADLFTIRRNIVYYENFNIGNNWRLQGVKSNATFHVRNSETRFLLNGFATRTRPTNYYNVPDRFLAGGSLQPVFGKNVQLGINYVRFFDLATKTSTNTYSNDVLTGNAQAGVGEDKVRVSVSAEGGYSFTKYKTAQVVTRNYNDFFWKATGEIWLKGPQLRISGSYLETGALFSSPSAQTLRIDARKISAIFPYLNNNSTARGQLMFDRLTQENIYNQTIFPALMPYLPQYGNAMPYGAATPNRRGLTGSVDAGTDKSIASAFVSTQLLTEVIGEGTAAKRNFHVFSGGGIFRLGKLLDSDRILEFKGSITYEQTKRGSLAAVGLTNRFADVGITVEVLRNIDLMGGYKLSGSLGNEFVPVRDDQNQISSYNTYSFNFTQHLLAGGVRWRFSEKSFFTVHGNYTSVIQNGSESKNNYSIMQYFVNYTLSF